MKLGWTNNRNTSTVQLEAISKNCFIWKFKSFPFNVQYQNIHKELFTRQEVKTILRRLKNNKSPAAYGEPAELFKAGGKWKGACFAAKHDLVRWIHVQLLICKSTLLYYENGDPEVCAKYRRIFLTWNCIHTDWALSIWLQS